MTDERVVITGVDTGQKMAYFFEWEVGHTSTEGPKMDLDPVKLIDPEAELDRVGGGVAAGAGAGDR